MTARKKWPNVKALFQKVVYSFLDYSKTFSTVMQHVFPAIFFEVIGSADPLTCVAEG